MCGKIIYDRGEIKLGLENMDSLMALLGHPENDVPAIQIAGTNGKGSTGLMIGKILEATGLKVGYYQTPAVSDPMEIIRIGNRCIKEATFEKLKNQIAKKVKKAEVNPTKFELDTAVAFTYFSKRKCDVSIIEVGLGGDTDATNIVRNTIASVITPIGMDHMEYLGDSIEEIAGHKAGIIKKAPTVVARQSEQALNVIKKVATANNSMLYIADALAEDGSWNGIEGIRLGLKGSYQYINAGTALTAIEALKASWKPLESVDREMLTKAIKKGLKNIKLFGRFTVHKGNPELVIDGAHNEPAAYRLAEAVERKYPDRPRIYVTGAFKDKDYVKTLSIVLKDPKLVVTLKAPGPRGLEEEKLAAEVEKLGMQAIAVQTVAEAIELACDEALKIKNERPVIIAFGSLSWLKEAEESYEAWKENHTR